MVTVRGMTAQGTEYEGQVRPVDPAKEAAKAVWGATPAGWTHAPHDEIGSQQYLARVIAGRDAELAWLDELVPWRSFTGKLVLEVGSGAGYDALRFTRAEAEYTGVDLAPENVERTRSSLVLDGQSGRVLLADAEALPFEAASFDVYWSNGVLHHVPDIARALSEARRVLVPGGETWIALYNRDSVFYWWSLFLGQHLFDGGWRRESFGDRLAAIERTSANARPLVRVYSRRQVRNLVRAAGFDVRGAWIRKLRPEDVRYIGDRLPAAMLDRLGHWLGWYVIVRATVPR